MHPARAWILSVLSVAIVCGTGGRPAAAEEAAPAPGTLVELKRATALEQVLATRGVLLLDCFADW